MRFSRKHATVRFICMACKSIKFKHFTNRRLSIIFFLYACGDSRDMYINASSGPYRGRYAHASMPYGKIAARTRVVLMKNDIHAALPSSIIGYFRIFRMLKNSRIAHAPRQ